MWRWIWIPRLLNLRCRKSGDAGQRSGEGWNLIPVAFGRICLWEFALISPQTGLKQENKKETCKSKNHTSNFLLGLLLLTFLK